MDQKQDYISYLRPFILQTLIDRNPDSVTDKAVQDALQEQFGLDIPVPVVHVALKRLTRENFLQKEQGLYRITRQLPDPGIKSAKANAQRHIQAVIEGLIDYSKQHSKPIKNSDDAVTAICAFLSRFNISCLRAHLRGTAIPAIEGNQNAGIVLVGKFVVHLQRSNPERFDSFLIVVQGHMLANALLCPDLQNAPKTYRGVTLFFDTPLLIRQLGLEGDAKKAAIDDLIKLLRNLGATIAMFSHSRDELDRNIKKGGDFIASQEGRGPVVMEARRRGTTKSDFLLLVGQLDKKLKEAKIKIINTPRHIAECQINEREFEAIMDDKLSYHNSRAKAYDINSVRSIYVLRNGLLPTSVEKSKAILVTSNCDFASAAFNTGKNISRSKTFPA